MIGSGSVGSSQPFQSDSYRNPSGFPPEAGTGFGRSSTNENVSSRARGDDGRAARIAARKAAERRTTENHERAREWARKAFPEDADTPWLDLIAGTARTINSRGMKLSRQEVVRRLVANGHPIHGDPEYGIPALKGAGE